MTLSWGKGGDPSPGTAWGETPAPPSLRAAKNEGWDRHREIQQQSCCQFGFFSELFGEIRHFSLHIGAVVRSFALEGVVRFGGDI